MVEIGVECLNDWKEKIDEVGQKEKRDRLHVGHRYSV
jgi:hypothetical protein